MAGLHLRNVSHAFGDHTVVSDVSVEVAPGELVCLLGPSGCGKTTLLRVAAGLEMLQSGRVSIGEEVLADGQATRHTPPERRGVGLMFQDFALFPHLNVRDNIGFGVDGHDIERRQWIEEALQRAGLGPSRDAYPHTLSGGQQQRVALLRALATKPRVMLLDEPFSGLDVTRRAAIRQQTLSLLKETEAATLMVTHDPEEAMFMADRILVMLAGRIIQDGSPVDVYFNPTDGFVTRLFGTVNRVETTVRDGHAETPLGTFAAPGFIDGTRVEVLLRPEAFRVLDASSAGAPVQVGFEPACEPAKTRLRVLRARPLGRSSHVEFEAVERGDGGDGAGLPEILVARIPGVFLPEAGADVRFAIDARQVHIFTID